MVDALIVVAIILIIASIYTLISPFFKNIYFRFFPHKTPLLIVYYIINIVGASIAFAIIYGSVKIIMLVL